MVSFFASEKKTGIKSCFICALLFHYFIPFVDLFFDVAPIFSSFVIILLRKRELVNVLMCLLSFGFL